MVKVKCITNYQDRELNRLVKNGEELEVTEDRAEVLVKANVCVKVAATTPTAEKVEKEEVKEPKKKAVAKKK